MSTDGKWVGGKWIPDSMAVMTAQFLALYGEPAVSHPRKVRRQAKPKFKPSNILGISPAEYRRRHLGAH